MRILTTYIGRFSQSVVSYNDHCQHFFLPSRYRRERCTYSILDWMKYAQLLERMLRDKMF